MAISHDVHEHVPGRGGMRYVSRKGNLGLAAELSERCGAWMDNAGAVRLDLHPSLLGLLGEEALPVCNRPPSVPAIAGVPDRPNRRRPAPISATGTANAKTSRGVSARFPSKAYKNS